MDSQRSVPTVSRAEDRSDEKTLLWRCGVCGELYAHLWGVQAGEVDEIPSSGPDCEAPRGELGYLNED